MVSGQKGTSLSEEESHILIGFLEATTALVRFALSISSSYVNVTSGIDGVP